MVYPALDATTPPPLVQVASSVIALEAASTDPLQQTPKRSAPPLPPAPTNATAVDLGHPLHLSQGQPVQNGGLVEVSADSQEYDAARQVLTAIGNVLLNYRTAVLKADRVQTLALKRQVLAEGNVTLTRGDQVLQGDRLEYQLDQETGILFKPKGVINLPSASQDFSPQTPATTAVGNNPLGGLQESLPQSNPARLGAKQSLQRLRFEADRIEFTGQTWRAVNIRITSDPFSPPELELRADQAQLQRISATEDVVTLRRPRLVFDQGIALPIPRSKVVLSRQQRNPFTVDFGFDDRDRGGLFLGSRLTPVSSRAFTLSLTPQFFVERAIFNRGFNLLSPDLYGLNVQASGQLSSKLRFGSYVLLRSADVTELADNLRAGLKFERSLGNNRLAFEAAYRERLFNGSLGEETIQNRTGFIFSTPTQQIGQTDIEFNARLSAELLTATSDRFGGLDTVSLGRFQGSASVQRPFSLWKGKTLPPTATQGLRYTPEPLQPYLRIVAGLTGVASGYTNGDAQTNVIGKVKLEGQFGHFSRPYLDYTGFFIGFSQGAQFGESPFLFDRFIDRQVLSAGILQQVYGPVRLGFQSSFNLETGELFNTDIIVDYSRRSYGITLRYNPNLQVGSLVFRINSFNWISNPDPFTDPGTGVVEGGVGQTNAPF